MKFWLQSLPLLRQKINHIMEASNRVNARLPKPLAEHVKRMVGSEGLFETPSEYIRALIRKDMESDASLIFESILEGFQDHAEGRSFESTGDWKKDKALLQKKEAEGWT